MKKQFTAQVVITVQDEGPFFMAVIREAASNAISVDLSTEMGQNALPTGGSIIGVAIDWNTLIDKNVADEQVSGPPRDPNKTAKRMRRKDS